MKRSNVTKDKGEKRLKSIIKISIMIIIFGILLWMIFDVFKVQDKMLRLIYPKEYEIIVTKYAKENNLDPLLVFAIMKAESNFDSNITSHSGACGLMQLMDQTAREVALKIGYSYTGVEILFDPETNIMLGTAYFSMLYQQYHNVPIALTAYNAGIGNVQKWITNGIIKEDGSNIENIPFTETNNYVRKILRDYDIYKELYSFDN